RPGVEWVGSPHCSQPAPAWVHLTPRLSCGRVKLSKRSEHSLERPSASMSVRPPELDADGHGEFKTATSLLQLAQSWNEHERGPHACPSRRRASDRSRCERGECERSRPE